MTDKASPLVRPQRKKSQVEISRLKGLGVLLPVSSSQPFSFIVDILVTPRPDETCSQTFDLAFRKRVVEEFALGKVLPGQRDGSLLWCKSLTGFLAEHLQMQPLPLYPCLLKSRDLKCLMLLHVDDILVVCSKEYMENCLLKAVQVKYNVSAEVMQFCGDSVTFLKRRLLLESFDKMIVYPHPKHFTRLFELVGVKKTWKPKNVPAHSQILERCRYSSIPFM